MVRIANIGLEAGTSTLDDLLADYTITHVVMRGNDAALDCGYTIETFRSDEYAVFRIER